MYDYIVVGGGTSGCVLAAELPADPAVRVLLPEAGGRGGGPLFAIPKASIFVTESSKRYSYLYETEAVAPAGRPGIWLRGRVLGGSSATNGMIYNPGWRDDGDDQRRTFALLRRLREIAAADPLAAMVDAEAAPGDTVVDDRTIVMDASVLPAMVAGNTNAPLIAMSVLAACRSSTARASGSRAGLGRGAAGRSRTLGNLGDVRRSPRSALCSAYRYASQRLSCTHLPA